MKASYESFLVMLEEHGPEKMRDWLGTDAALPLFIGIRDRGWYEFDESLHPGTIRGRITARGHEVIAGNRPDVSSPPRGFSGGKK